MKSLENDNLLFMEGFKYNDKFLTETEVLNDKK